jgi:hypothetical protein
MIVRSAGIDRGVFYLALGAPAHAGCVGLSGTADGFDKETAVSRAQLALAITSSNTRRRNISAPSR